ncbi:MAG TPA: hypothetical protein VFS34_04840 [Thermoanaerobaculia bacterium]|nr:hypothetical protein [Thermoanaerobaculia bacterium]
MKRSSIPRTSLALAAALALAAVVCPRRASAQVFAHPEGDHWAWAIALEPWAPTINGDLNQGVPPAEGNGTPGERFNVKIGPNDYLRNLKFALPLAIDIRNRRFSILTDIGYVDFSQDSNITGVRPAASANGIEVTGNLGTKTDLKGLLWTEGFGWTVAGSPDGSFLDLLVGVQFFGLKSETKWHLEGTITGPGGNEVILSKDGKASNNANLWDGIFGIRGKARIGRQWAVPYYADIGAGTSKLTWSGAAGIAFEPGNWQFALSWRQISWSQKDDKLVQGLRVGGPALAIGYAF